MTKEFIDYEDLESKELVDRSCQLVYKALAQQIKILLSVIIDSETKNTPNKTFFRILELLTPFEKNDVRLHPNFYVNFIQHSPQLTWQFIQDYIFEYVMNKKLPSKIYFLPEDFIANLLNRRDSDYNDEDVPRYQNKDGLDILKKIVVAAKLSLFLENQDEGAASFAIRWMQYKLKIDLKKLNILRKIAKS